MTELKTLKDIVNASDFYDAEEGRKHNLKSEDDLRKEAIKWIKHFQKEIAKFEKLTLATKLAKEYEQIERITKRDWIMMFFNITEDDLK